MTGDPAGATLIVTAVMMGVIYVVVAVLALALGMPAVFRARVRSMMPSGRSEVGLKRIDGVIPGLPHGWSSGTVDLGPDGWLTFHSYVWGLRGMHRPPVRVHVTEVVDAVPRRPGWPRVLRVLWYTRIIVLRTTTGTIELAIEGSVAPWLLGQLFAPVTPFPPAVSPIPGAAAAAPGPPALHAPAPPPAPTAPSSASPSTPPSTPPGDFPPPL